MMKNYFLLFFMCMNVGMLNAQLIKQDNQSGKKQSDLDWYNCSFEKDGVYGAEVNKAYELLKREKLKKKPVVALIGTGIDIEHEDLKGGIWFNPKEKNNGKDNDKNGLIGDVSGWNFLGGKEGTVMEFTTREGEREFLSLQDKYADYLFDGKNFYKIIDGQRTKVAAPTNMDEYLYFRNHIMGESQIAGNYGGYQLSYLFREYADKFDRDMKKRFPGKELTIKEFESCYDEKAPRDSLGEVAFVYMAMAFQVHRTESWEKVYDGIRAGRQLALAKKNYETSLKAYGEDYREEIVGDNYLDIKDDKYGNNILLTSDAATGTMQAGIVTARRENGIGIDGIVDAEIMTLRVQGTKGEPYLKDLALAIRYAVEHNADIIVLPEQNTLYPKKQRVWIEEALCYAEDKGVLVIVPTWDLSMDLAQTTFYPNRWMMGEKELTNLLVVSPSDKYGNPAINSNYGVKEVDLYAPGVDVYSLYPGDSYRMVTGGKVAAAVTAGVAALVKAYYPKLTGTQIRNILLESVTSRKGVEVEKGIRIEGQRAQDLYLFDDLCVTGGILNAFQALKVANEWQSGAK